LAKRKIVRNPDIRVENSAPSQRRSAFSVRWSAPILARQGVTRVADFGSGTLRNLPMLEKQFDEITLVETEIRCDALKDQIKGKNHISLKSTRAFEEDCTVYDAVFFVCVLHTIPDAGYREQLIRTAVAKIRPSGFIIVDVPQSETYYNRRRRRLPRYKDGYLLRWGDHYSFYKSFYRTELDSMFLKVRGMELFQKTWCCKHPIRIWRTPETK
jgi:SAM-dependent methyltransferase